MPKMLLFIGLLTCGMQMPAQNPTAPPCQSPEYRQMDFWTGEWDVFNPKGQLVGTNRIEQILGSCVLMENWQGKGGSVGNSFNIYNQQTKRWEQTWVDNSGSAIYFHGQWKDGIMDYRSDAQGPDGKPLQFKMTFEPQQDGSVHQLWSGSSDGGEQWNLIFDGMYKRKISNE